MQYNNTFINQNLCIKVYTNSKRIYKLIENFLDFDNKHWSPKSKIKIDFSLNEVKRKESYYRNFLYQNLFTENNNLLSFFNNKIAGVTIDPKRRVVKGIILGYKDSLKEYILEVIFNQPLRFILAHYGLFFIHTSVVYKDRDCIFISGPQDSGKSTIALTLAKKGFNLLTDDKCFIKLAKNKIKIISFPTKMGLKDGILKSYSELNKYALKNYYYGKKRRLSLNSISPNFGNTEEHKCKIIIFPKYKVNRNTYIKRVSKKEALDRLIKENLVFCPKKEFEKMFWALYNLASKTSAFELIYNDARLNEVPKIVNKIF